MLSGLLPSNINGAFSIIFKNVFDHQWHWEYDVSYRASSIQNVLGLKVMVIVPGSS